MLKTYQKDIRYTSKKSQKHIKKVLICLALASGCSSTKPPTSPCSEYVKIRINQYQESKLDTPQQEQYVYNQFGNRIARCDA